MRIKISIFLIALSQIVSAQSWYQYAYHDTAQTFVNTAVVIDVQANDSLNPPTNAYNYIPNPITCDYPFIYGPLQSKYGGTLLILNDDSIEYTPANNFTGMDNFYYGICDSGTTYTTDTTTVIIEVLPANSVSETTGLFNVKLYPNPSEGHFTIEMLTQSLLFDMEAILIDIPGNIVSTTTVISSITEINTYGLDPGIYFLQLKNQAGSCQTYKISIK